MSQSEVKLKRLRKASFITLLAIYVLILVGGIVRSTGSGMGCPDWPKCFGRWIPPTSVEQLPDGYQDEYTDQRLKKNKKLANYLKAMGMTGKAEALLNDELISHETPFNATKTWVEYINRLIGAIIGLLSIMTVAAAFPQLKRQRHVFFVALGVLLLVIFQGWLGSVVVSTNLLPWMVTIHMVPALAIVAMLIYLTVKSSNDNLMLHFLKSDAKINVSLVICVLLLFVQIILGTQVREAIDVAALDLGELQRDYWISSLGIEFLVHRSFSWMIVISHGALMYLLFRRDLVRLNNIYGSIVVAVLLSVGTGIVMAYLGIPAFIQPLHLLWAIILFGLQFWVFFKLNMKDMSPLSNEH